MRQNRERVKVLHVTTGLESGGAEAVLCSLAGRLDPERFACRVVSLTDEGPVIGARIRAGGIPVECLGGARGVPHPRLISRLAGIIRREKPDVIQTWMYHADLVGGLAARVAGGSVPVVWGLHNTGLDPRQTKPLTRAVVSLNRWAARFLPRRIVCCSEATLRGHAALGYPAQKMMVIPNGIDVNRFVADDAAPGSVRAELGLPPDTPLIGLMARFHPQKDHQNFFAAAGLLSRERPDAHFLLCGSGVTVDNAALSDLIEKAGVASQTHLLGLRTDLPRLTAALDAATCSSAYGEAWPLVLGEAMASGVPVVTTDLAGPVSIVEEAGWIVPVRDAAALAGAWRDILALSAPVRQARTAAARRRIVEQFSLDRMVGAYADVYTEMASLKARGEVVQRPQSATSNVPRR